MMARATTAPDPATATPEMTETANRTRTRIPFSACVGLVILATYAAVMIVGPYVAPYSTGEIISVKAYAQQSEDAFLGTDALGRDLLSRMLHGARLTLLLAFTATALGFVGGVVLGFACAEYRGWFDGIMMRLIDVIISIPPIMFALVVIAAIGSSIPSLIGIVAVVQAPRVARVARAVAMDISVLDFVEVARARGESVSSLLQREILPNSIRPLAADFGMRFTYSILYLAALSFLGLGIQPPESDWGGMVRENLVGLYFGASAALVPAAAIATLTVGINLVCDWLASGRDISRELLR